MSNASESGEQSTRGDRPATNANSGGGDSGGGGGAPAAPAAAKAPSPAPTPAPTGAPPSPAAVAVPVPAAGDPECRASRGCTPSPNRNPNTTTTSTTPPQHNSAGGPGGGGGAGPPGGGGNGSSVVGGGGSAGGGNGNGPPVVQQRPSKPCCFCWCCCCSCSWTKCLAVKNGDDRPKAPELAGNGEPLPTLDEIRSWGKSFDKLMRSAAGRNVFRDFLKCEYSEENILFWLACEELKKESNPDVVEEKARFIYEDYISILSPKEVSLDSRVREIVNRNMVDPTPHTFDEAQLQIYTLMHRDSYPRFVNSSQYKSLAQINGGGTDGGGGGGSASGTPTAGSGTRKQSTA